MQPDRVTLGDLSARAARRTPDRTAFVDAATDESVTFAEFETLATRAANALLDAGLDPGDRFAVVADNSIDCLLAQFGALKAGVTAVLLNADLAADDLAYQLGHAEVDGIAVDGDLVEKVEPFLEDANGDAAADADGGAVDPVLAIRGADGYPDFRTFVEAGDADPPEVEIAGGDDALIMYTSGTTGRPKGVVHTHDSYAYNVANVIAACDLSRFDTQVAVLPLFHIQQDSFAKAALGVSATTVIYRAFDPETVLEDVEARGLTYLNLMASMYRRLFEAGAEEETYDLSGIRRCVYGMPMEMSLRERVVEETGAKLRTVCGQTEAGITLYFDPEWQLEKPGNYVGRTAAFADAAIVDEDGTELPQGEEGEIGYRGPTIMDRYLKAPEKTADTWRGGWHRSGDVGVVDEDGQIRFVDRKKDLVKTGGENVSSTKVENVVGDHPDVGEAAVVGLPHSEWGEAVTAFVVPAGDAGGDLDPEAVRAHASERLAGFETPKEVVVVEDLPHTATGKIRKRALASRHEDYYRNENRT